MNNIPQRQNERHAIDKLKAQRHKKYHCKAVWRCQLYLLYHT